MTTRPRLRGLLRLAARSSPLILVSPTGRAALAGMVYGLSLVALFGVNALFHRVT